jgi:hypothetical protein
MIVYSNSCSFGATTNYAGYSELIAKHFNSEIINKGKPGACNRRIIRTSIRDLLDLKKQHNEIICLIGLTFISRTELWQPTIPADSNDGNFHSIIIDFKKLNWITGLVNTEVSEVHLYAPQDVQEYYKQWLVHMSKEAILADLTADIIMFLNFCQAQKIKLLLWSNTQIWPSDPVVAINDVFFQTFYQTVTSDNAIINPWKFSFRDYALQHGFRPVDEHQFGDDGHPGRQAHEFFAKYLLNYIKEKEII